MVSRTRQWRGAHLHFHVTSVGSVFKAIVVVPLALHKDGVRETNKKSYPAQQPHADANEQPHPPPSTAHNSAAAQDHNGRHDGGDNRSIGHHGANGGLGAQIGSRLSSASMFARRAVPAVTATLPCTWRRSAAVAPVARTPFTLRVMCTVSDRTQAEPSSPTPRAGDSAFVRMVNDTIRMHPVASAGTFLATDILSVALCYGLVKTVGAQAMCVATFRRVSLYFGHRKAVPISSAHVPPGASCVCASALCFAYR